MKTLALGAIVVGLAFGAPASAQDDFNGATQILQGDYAAAERVILLQRRMFPADADLLLNLATTYRLSGRTSEARALYRQVLANPDDLMDMPAGASPRSSHRLAAVALVTLDRRQVSAR